MVADDERPLPLDSPTLNEIATAQLTALEAHAQDKRMLTLCQVDFTDAAAQRHVFGDYLGSASADTARPIAEEAAATRRTLTAFFKWAATEVEKRGIENTRYAVIFWGHSAGPSGLFRDPSPSTANPTLKLPDLAGSLGALGKPYVDLVIFQDCWMSTLEVAYELKDVVRFMIASQKLVRPMKVVWPFGDLFDELRRDGTPNLAMLEAIAKRLTREYEERGHADIPFSALTLDAAPSIAPPLTRLADALEALTDQALVDSRTIVRTSLGGDEALLDVRRMCKRLRTAEITKQEALDLERVVNTLVVCNTASVDSGLTGVSVFRRPSDDKVENSVFAESVSLHRYNELALSQETSWGNIAFEERFQLA
jgi:hypothetical protein